MSWSWDKERYKTGANLLHRQLLKVLKDIKIETENYLNIGCGEGTVTALRAFIGFLKAPFTNRNGIKVLMDYLRRAKKNPQDKIQLICCRFTELY